MTPPAPGAPAAEQQGERITPCAICGTPVRALPPDGPQPICGDRKACIDDALDKLGEEGGACVVLLIAQDGTTLGVVSRNGTITEEKGDEPLHALRRAVGRARGYTGGAL